MNKPIKQTNKKCICKKLDQGFVNLTCPVHIVMPKIDKKFLADKETFKVGQKIKFGAINISSYTVKVVKQPETIEKQVEEIIRDAIIFGNTTPIIGFTKSEEVIRYKTDQIFSSLKTEIRNKTLDQVEGLEVMQDEKPNPNAKTHKFMTVVRNDLRSQLRLALQFLREGEE